MKMSEAFPSIYLKCADLQGRPVKAVIDRVEMMDIGDDRKPVVFFQGKNKGMVLNKTNATMIVHYYGDDSINWRGQEIILYPDKVPFKGELVDALRVRVEEPKPAPVDSSDDIPF